VWTLAPRASAAAAGGTVHGDLLGEHEVFHTRDLAEARDLTSQITGQHTLGFHDGSRRCDSVLRAFPITEDVCFLYFFYGGNVRVEVPEGAGSLTLLQTPLGGPARVECAGFVVDQDEAMGTVVEARRRMRMDFTAETHRLVTAFRPGFLTSTLTSMLGHPPREDLVLDGEAPTSAYVHRLARQMAREVGHGLPLLDSRAGRERLAELLATTLLMGQPNNYLDRLRAPVRPAAPYYVRRAEEYIAANAARAVTMSELSQVTGVSTRAIQTGFRRFRQTTPMTHLREVRLARVREELLGGGCRTVTDVAMRWGFSSLGRFAAAYREAYGEPPSQTLRRST